MREPSTGRPVGAGLPPTLRERLAAGCWLRTAHGGGAPPAPPHTPGAVEVREVAGLVGNRATLMLDLKEDGLERGIVEALRGSPFEPVVVCGHYWGSMREIERQIPGTAVSLTLDRKWQDLYG